MPSESFREGQEGDFEGLKCAVSEDDDLSGGGRRVDADAGNASRISSKREISEKKGDVAGESSRGGSGRRLDGAVCYPGKTQI
jgi:hypothetical protein